MRLRLFRRKRPAPTVLVRGWDVHCARRDRRPGRPWRPHEDLAFTGVYVRDAQGAMWRPR